ncbi:PEP-CTERM sorting domain-containing protein [Botrimarina mediterranea]|uniref:PEP-CTERM sorting domain-containing protein n=1 Tax=Botrimarina mediterranea TaxID=2528022 RepID=UPI0011A91EB2|nr:PEP-CTERM sorting domain-containing protein [Botrimarina mediterranea]
MAAHDPSYYGDLLQGVLDVTCIRFAPHLLLPSLALLVAAPAVHAVPLLNTNASVLAINTSPPATDSFYFPGEGADSAIDGISNTKYLNLGQPPNGIGLAVEPLFGNTIAQSIQFTTADDAVNRDPAGWILYGSNDFLSSADNSGLDGGENWTQIANGALEFPEDRLTQLPAINFANSTAYNNYRIEFTGAKGGPGGRDAFNGIQIADVQLYTAPDAGGSGVFGIADYAIAYQLPQPASFYFADESPANIVDYAYTASSSYPAGENPGLLVDGDTGTKYLNFGGPNSGFIVTPDSPAQVQSFIVTSANDAIDRHPTSWQLFGTNDPITSLDNSFGDAENWVELGSGSIEVPPGLFTDSPVVSVPNANAYSSYKMLFPTTNGAGLMQISEASFFTSADGTGQDILEVGTPSLLAIDTNRGATKNFNAGGPNSGFIITPAVGTTIVDGFEITTGGDATHRDPATWELYGTNESIVSEDNSQGEGENWTLISSGAFSDLEVSLDRNVTGDVVALTNSTEYTSYKFVFPTLRDPEQDNGFQVADIQLFGDIVTPAPSLGDFNADGLVDAADYTVWRDNLNDPDESALNGNGDGGGVTQSDYDLWVANYGKDYSLPASLAIPEPSTSAMVLGLLSLFGLRQKRN